jgi:hypothetical protein
MQACPGLLLQESKGGGEVFKFVGYDFICHNTSLGYVRGVEYAPDVLRDGLPPHYQDNRLGI